MRQLRIPLALSLAVALAACGSDSDEPAPTPPGTIVQVAQGNADLSILVEAVLAADADVAAALTGPGPLTVFAPTNAAFAALLTELGVSKAQLLADKPLVTAVLKYHVLAARVLKAQIPLGTAISPLQGGVFKIDQVGADFVIQDGRNRTARIIATDVPASNGTVHLIDKVILPADKNIVQTAQGNADLSILVEAVLAADADVAAALSGPGPLTVFAPTNAAFAALLGELGVTKAQLLADKPLVTAVLKYHVLAARVLKAQIPLGKAITPLQGGVFKIDRVGADFVIQDGRNRTARITATDVAASNGTVHLVDKVILPADKNIVQTAQGVADFSILVEAVLAADADVAAALTGPGPLTVFAPTNAAFALLLTELGVTKAQLLADKPLLTAVLKYHVIPGRVLKADVVPGVQPATVQGQSFSISAALAITDGRGRTAGISGTDVLASNGVIHVLDRVILPSP